MPDPQLPLQAQILAISGSLRARSVNLHLLRNMADMLPAGFDLQVFQGIQDLPHFNPDLDTESASVHEGVQQLRQQVSKSAGVIICTPEYAAGVPGSLKNALDWLVSSGEFVHRPVAVVTASPFPTGGDRAHGSLLGTLQMMTARLPAEASLTVPLVNTRINPLGEITDSQLLDQLQQVVTALCSAVLEPELAPSDPG